MATGPKLTGPVERLGTFRHFLNADTGSCWNVATEAAMVALVYTVAGDTVYVGDTKRSRWLVIPAASLPVTADCLNGTGSSVQYLRHGIPLATESVNGLMSSTQVVKLNALRKTRHKATTNAQMQALTVAEVGDDCCVSTSTDDNVWLTVTRGKYPYGLNCLIGTGSSTVDWFSPIDRIRGIAQLSAGHAFVYIPGLTTSAVATAPGYVTILGQPGVLVASVVANGLNIDSWNNPFDGSLVSYDVTP